jgi:hypothetical protein
MFCVNRFFSAIRGKLQALLLMQDSALGKRRREINSMLQSVRRHHFYVLLLVIIPLHSASAAEGVITEHLPDCNYFVLKTDEGYAVMEWNGESKPDRNDHLFGNITAGAMNVLENDTRGGKVKVWVEMYPVSYDDAMNIYRDECQ